MSETKHTPGPWLITKSNERDPAQFNYRIGIEDVRLATVPRYSDEDEANARLISAAPELLLALRDLRAELRNVLKLDVKKHYSLMVADVVADKAIAKAEGR